LRVPAKGHAERRELRVKRGLLWLGDGPLQRDFKKASGSKQGREIRPAARRGVVARKVNRRSRGKEQLGKREKKTQDLYSGKIWDLVSNIVFKEKGGKVGFFDA